MGRSKFPGKPSKSINRKRISVLQLEEDAAAAAVQEQEDGLTAATTTANINEKNKRNNEDDDENGKGGNSGGASSGGVGSSAAATGDSNGAQSNRGVNGSNGSTSNSNNNGNSSGNGNVDSEDTSTADAGAAVDNASVTSAATSSAATAKPAIGDKNANDDATDVDELLGDDVDVDDNNDEDDCNEDDDEDDDDNASCTSRKSLQSTTSSTSASSYASNKSNRRFKNLNLAKAEVMLPSSSKLRQQQQQQEQLNCPSPSSSNGSGNPFAAESKDLAGIVSDTAGDALNNTAKLQKNAEMSVDGTCNPSDTPSDSSNANSENETNTCPSSATPGSSNDAASGSTSTTAKQKKTVTFKNILETSDDKSAVKKFYNPDNRIPLVSIIKKECMNRPLMYSRSSECIVRPSRLTEILKNNSNIDKLNCLKFRSYSTTSAASSEAETDATAGTTSSVFGMGLLRAFGAPLDDDHNHDTVTFRLSDTYKNEAVVPPTEEKDDDTDGDTAIDHEEQAQPHNEDGEEGETVEGQEEEEEEEEQQLIVDKHFVLPKRSTRSSRVIKPNKRLLEDGIICQKKCSNVAKPKAVTTNAANTAPSQQPQKKDQHNYFGLRDFAAADEDAATSIGNKGAKEATATESKHGFALFSLPFGGVKTNNFVLRQPRLQFDSLSDRTSTLTCSIPKLTCSNLNAARTPSAFTLASGISSTTSPNSASLGDSTSCGVCGTPIHHKNMPQANKYGTATCGACRKFISKMAKNSTSAPLKYLQCKADGNCSLQPQTKGHLKNFKKICKERCLSCWLKKCMQTLQLPAGDKLRFGMLLKEVEAKKEKDPAADNIEAGQRRESSEQLSPTGLFAAARFKWKSALETAAEALKLNLKTNPLAENKVTFGSSPILLRPAVLESLFLKNVMEQKEKPDNSPTAPEKVESPKVEKQLDKSTKLKRKEKHEKEREKDKEKEKAKDKDKDIAVGRTGKVEDTAAQTTTKQSSTTADNEVKSEASSALGTVTSVASDVSSAPSSSIQKTPTTAALITGTNVASTSTATAPSDAQQKRQRIALKGPRVKHVCRSASIVLGQPLATFGEDDETVLETDESTEPFITTTVKEDNESKSITDIVIDENDNCSSCKEHQLEPTAAVSSEVEAQPESTSVNAIECVEPPAPKTAKIVSDAAEKKSETPKHESVAEKPLPLQPTKANTRNINTSNINLQVQQRASNSHYSTVLSKKYMRQFNDNVSQLQLQQQQAQRRKEPAKAKALISIDFWENYDPAEVCQTGFGLIITETVAQRALCFLCGSAGLDPLIFCACCCEPYHQYCVTDEYNLKHSSLDETMASFLDMSTMASQNNAALADNFNQMTNRLNWLCPRCTVCYTCNMSSGSKVKCQKCQKNYHSTCLGTSKRLLGADRPLICVNCLKCKSCSTTKVSKFVGNLPMCTSCFKLRKKGNYCPICQKCYDDNDFDLKMMECGDCSQWVHSKCEGLSDEQYNLLSTLPESIEFICKKCARHNESSKQKAEEWRQAVMEEFKSSLLSVLKLLSKSRQACALLKLSPRKKMRCICSGNNGTQTGNGKIQPKALQFNNERDPLGSDGESQCSEDIYEFKDKIEEEPKPKLKCTCMKGISSASSSFYNSQANNLSLVDIKKKIRNNAYVSLAEFNYDMNNVIQSANFDELVIAYKEILSEQFPWFQNETKACTDALEEDMFESCSYTLGSSIDSQGGFGDDEQNRSVIDLPDDIEEVIYSLKSRDDTRLCLFCRKSGEGMPNEESRLLYCGHDCWVHTNCAMWSAEVFEEIDGSLQNVHSAVSRGRMIKCTVCGNRGATVGCNVKACGEHYHYPCARSIRCAFLTDKTMYCPEHAKDASKINSASVTIETNFEVSRPVYVELDRKRKKLIEPANVQFHIGSLEVKQLGTVFPRFSDSFEAIIPINFLCSRLYWSCKEPWKIVEYTVRTTIQNSFSTLTSLDNGRNFTVDHTNPNASMVQLGLAQISRWHNSIARGELMEFETAELANMRASTLTKFYPEYLSHNQNSSSATDDNTEEEPQTNADLLPPEIKDAIFEDLPHEILDGISMLDIFPKFMIYEEMGNSDGKTEMFLNDQSKDGSSGAINNTANAQISDEDTANSSFSKQLDLSNSWSSSNITMNHVEDALLSCSRTTGSATTQVKRGICATEMQRNKAEMLKKAPQQRPWSKVDNNSAVAAAAIKRRKLSKGLQDMRVNESVLLSLNQQRSKKETASVVAFSRRQSQSGESETATRTKTFTWSAAKRYIDAEVDKDDGKIKLMQVDGVDDSITEYRIISADGQFNGTVKCDRCHCTYRTYESFQRHLATCEPLSTSESDSEAAPRSPETSASTSPLTDNMNELNKLGAAAQRMTANTLTANAGGLPFLQAFPQTIPIGNLQSNLNGIPITSMQNLQGLQSFQNLQNLQGLQNIQLQNLQPQTLGGNFFISQANPTNSAADEVQFFSNSLQGLTANLNGTYTLAPTTGYSTNQQQPQLLALSSNADGTQQIIQIPTGNAMNQQNSQLLQGTNAFQTLQATNSDKKIVLPVGGKPIKTVATKAAQQAASAAKNKLRAGTAVKPIQSKAPTSAATVTQQSMQQTPITVLSHNTNANTAQLLNQNLLQQMQAVGTQQPQLLFQTANNGNQQQQPIIMQQLSAANNAAVPQNIISFVTTGDNGQNPQIQYVTIPTTNDFKTQAQTASPFITATAAPNANALMQGTAFLQTDASGNLVLTTQAPSGLQMLNLAQPTQQQPQVIGTLIQPQTLQLGAGNVLTTSDPQQQHHQQVIIGGGGSTGLEMIANAAAPQVILATQPMYYGLETIVQNTVMSSQQFVSTAMPGVLSQNASFSATTTQVFQASKIEPIVDIPTGYVVLNNVDGSTSLVQQPQSQTTAGGAQQSNFLNASVLQQSSNEGQNNSQSQAPIYRIQTATTDSSAGTTSSFHYQFAEPSAHQTNVQIVTAKVPPVTQMAKRSNNNNSTKATPIAAVTKVQPQVINKVMPTTLAQQQKLKQLHLQQQHNAFQRSNNMTPTTIAMYNNTNTLLKTIPTSISGNIIAASLCNTSNPQIYTTVTPTTGTITTMAAKTLQPTVVSNAGAIRKTNLIRPIHKVEVKPKIMKTTPTAAAIKQAAQPAQQTKLAMLKPQLQLQTLQLAQPTQQQQQYQDNSIPANTNKILEYEPTVSQEYEQQQFEGTTGSAQANDAQELQQSFTNNLTYDFNQQQHMPQIDYENQAQYLHEVSKDNCEQLQEMSNSMATPTTSCAASAAANRSMQYANSTFHAHVPTNIVNPIQQQTMQYSSITTTMAQQQHHSSTLVSRPTNRVLPMQQRQENVSSSAAATTTVTAKSQTVAVTAKVTGAKSYESNEMNKLSYEAEVTKKDQQQLLQMMQQNNITPTEVLQMHEQHQADAVYSKSSAYVCEEDPLKCDLEVMEASCQQLQLVDDNGFVSDCLGSTKQEMMDAITSQAYSAENNIIAGGEDDDEDGFSLKMPTEDGEDHEMSDGDEPAVKEKISKILDNLTNEDCADSIATATTVEAANIQLNNANCFITDEQMENDEDAYAATAAERNAVVAAATEYISQMTENMNPETNFELKKLEAKLSPDIAMDVSVATAACTTSITSTTATSSDELCTRKPSPPPPPHPIRDPKRISGPHLLYEIQSEDGFTYKSTSITDVWEKVFEAVQVARRAHGLAPLPEGPLADMSGVQMIGLKTNALKYLIEQLPGVEKCSKYTPKYHRPTATWARNGATSTASTASGSVNVNNDSSSTLDYCSDHDDLLENPFECVRCEPYSKRSEYDMFSWLASRHRKQPVQVFVQPSDTELIPRRGTGSNLPMAMKYRTLKETYKDYVGVFRSHIHGRGLYCTKDIEAGEMVIEYAGELIRSTLTDKRERNYDSRGIGCYMFKIDENLVVDATMRGNAARFINHSCEPNCYSKVVDILGHKHIIIFALRRIVQGEELTYDYKFPFEDEKIPCSCGSKKCRKYLN